MKVDHIFASRVASLAAQMVADGWPYGTFDEPEWVLSPGVNVETAMKRAGYEAWGGPGWWRKSISLFVTRLLRSVQSNTQVLRCTLH